MLHNSTFNGSGRLPAIVAPMFIVSGPEIADEMRFADTFQSKETMQ